MVDELLDLLLEMTRDGVLVWRGQAEDYEAEAGRDRYLIRFRYPIYSDEDRGSDRDMAEIDTPAGQYRVFSGTAGMQKVYEILAVSIPSWQQHLERLRDHLERTRTKLDSLRKAKKPG